MTLRPPTPTRNPTVRRLRAAVALALACEKQAREPSTPLATRERSLAEAGRHLGAAWSILTTWTLDGAPADTSAKAAEFIGRINRRLPILASMLRAEAGLPCTFDHQPAEAA